jgi:hypothetical protein
VKKEKVRKIIVEEGVESLPYECFYECTLLEQVQLPSSLISIGKDSFYGCYKLAEIKIPEGVTTIGDGAFHKCE